MKNISKIISILFLIFSILLLCYVFYRSQIFHTGVLFGHYLKYYVIAFLFIFLSFISFFIPEKLKINIAVVFISVLIGLYLVEGYLLIENNSNAKEKTQDKYVVYKNNTGKNYDKRTRFQIYQDLKKEDPNIAVRIHPLSFLRDKNLNYFPLSGLANRKTIQCNENGYYSIYQSDRYGFNNPDKEWDKNVIDFFLVGDSLTNGSCVNEPDTISGNLRKLNNNENGILNLGQGGNGLLIEYATLREYLPTKKVKRVLLIYYEGNDLWDLLGELQNQILNNYLKDKNYSQNLVSRRQEMQKLLFNKLEQNILKKKRLNTLNISNLLKLKNMRTLTLERFFPTPVPKEFKNILQFSNKLIKKNNSKLYFVYMPENSRYSGNRNDKNFRNYYKITEIVKSLEIPIIDINKELFEKHEDPLSLFPFRISSHYTEKGYQLVAETIFNKIKILEK